MAFVRGLRKGGRRAEPADFWPSQRHPRLAVAGSKLRLRAATSFLRTLPDFIVIGAAKAGTSSLYSMICRHPRVLPAARKELNYFDDPRMYARGALWYRHYFPVAARKRLSGSLTGEATPSYFPHPHAAARIKQDVPRAKLILTLRNPTDRAYSHYNMRVRRGREYMSFEDALLDEPKRIQQDRERGAVDPSHKMYRGRHYAYTATGIYADHLPAWRERFGVGQLLVISAEQMRSDQQGVLGSVFEFLGLEPFEIGEQVALNRYPYPPMDPRTRERLLDLFRPHNERLYRMLGRRFDWDR